LIAGFKGKFIMKDQFLIWLWKNIKKIILYLLWLIVFIVLAYYFYGKLTGKDKSIFIQGKTSNGHYQIESDCYSCHETIDNVKLGPPQQAKCLSCHKEKKKIDTKSNSHRAKIFEAEGKAKLRDRVPADRCVSCHEEHQLGHAGVTQPVDFCILCHEDIAEEVVSHKNLLFNECNDCHNYHDNSVNYSKHFIEKHLNDELERLTESTLLTRNFSKFYKKKHKSKKPLAWREQDAPETIETHLAKNWENSSHALAGVNCQDCHKQKNKQWLNKPPPEACKTCHKRELKGFLESKHGMRIKQGLSPLSTGDARLPMKNEDHELSCTSCHNKHTFKIEVAAVESCLKCHNDEHSQAFKASKHYQLWIDKNNIGVSCATCHLPRIKKGKKVFVQHNQNENLRPKQKMVKTVCVNCHGFSFSIDALQDEELIDNNFSTKPIKHIPLLDMWKQKLNNN